MNRQQRRAQQKAVPGYLRGSKEDKIKALLKNGITPQDLEQEYRKGFEAGFKAAAPATFKAIYAAVCLALHDLHGFGRKRCAQVLTTVDGHVLETLTSEELIDDVWSKIGLQLAFNEPFDRIEERSDQHGKA